MNCKVFVAQADELQALMSEWLATVPKVKIHTMLNTTLGYPDSIEATSDKVVVTILYS